MCEIMSSVFLSHSCNWKPFWLVSRGSANPQNPPVSKPHAALSGTSICAHLCLRCCACSHPPTQITSLGTDVWDQHSYQMGRFSSLSPPPCPINCSQVSVTYNFQFCPFSGIKTLTFFFFFAQTPGLSCKMETL